MSKTLTDDQKKLLERVHQIKEQKQNAAPRPWEPGGSKVKRAGGPGLDPHIPQKKP